MLAAQPTLVFLAAAERRFFFNASEHADGERRRTRGRREGVKPKDASRPRPFFPTAAPPIPIQPPRRAPKSCQK